MKNIDNYDKIAKNFAKSRKNMKWEEIDYFFKYYLKNKENISILDVGCGSGRLLESLSDFKNFSYLGVDSSSGILKEAKANFPKNEFLCLDMENLDKLQDKKFDFVFFIASFHHKKDIKSREKTLQNLAKICHEKTIIFMTNWDLTSSLNYPKYKNSEIISEKNEFDSKDFLIKFGEYNRFYHSFSFEELEYLFKKTGFEIIENFSNERNILSIIKIK